MLIIYRDSEVSVRVFVFLKLELEEYVKFFCVVGWDWMGVGFIMNCVWCVGFFRNNFNLVDDYV